MKSNIKYYKKIFGEISRGNISPVYLLSGVESYIMEEMAEKISREIVEDSMRSFNLTVAYGTEVDIGEFTSIAKSFPFLAGKRVLILREGEKLRGNINDLIRYSNSPVESSVMILIFNTHNDEGRRIRMPKGYRELRSTVKKSGRVINFEKLKSGELQRWIVNKAARMGLEISKELAVTMINSVGENLYDLKNELDKLSLFFEDKPFGKKDLMDVIGYYKVNALFSFIDILKPGNELHSLEIVLRIINTGAERPSTVIYHMIRHFLSLLKIKAGYRTGGYFYRKLKKKANYFKSSEIILWLENLRKTELIIKNSSFPVELLFITLFIHTMKGERIDKENEFSRVA